MTTISIASQLKQFTRSAHSNRRFSLENISQLLLTAVTSNVITVFRFVDYYCREDATPDPFFYRPLYHLAWDLKLPAPILVAICISAKINTTLGCLINCNDGYERGNICGVMVESPLTDNFMPLLCYLLALESLPPTRSAWKSFKRNQQLQLSGVNTQVNVNI